MGSRFPFLQTAALLALPSVLLASDEVPEGLPGPVSETHFAAVTEESPFVRSIDVSDSLILTGIAKMDERVIVTLLDKETKETYVVTEKANPQGWKMTATKDNSDLEKVSATIELGAETVVVRYDESSLKAGEARPGGGGESTVSEGSRGRKGMKGMKGGKGEGRGGPPPEVLAKLQAQEDPSEPSAYVGQYGAVTISMEGARLMYSDGERENIPLYRLSNDVFDLESLETFRLRFDWQGDIAVGLTKSHLTGDEDYLAKVGV